MRNSGTNRDRGNHVHLDIELLSAYIDGEVTPNEATRVEQHLPVCRRCTEELESLRWTVSLLREVPSVPVPRSFAIRQIDIEREPTRRRFILPDWIPNSLQWATVATAVLAVLVFSVDFLGTSRLPTPTRLMQAPQAEEAAPKMVQETRELEIVKEGAPLAMTVQVERDKFLEPASGPQEVPAATLAPRQVAPQLRNQPPAEEPAAAAKSAAPAQPAEEQAQDAVVPEPTPAPELLEQAQPATRFPNPLRTIEIGLVGLFIILLSLTLGARRRRAA
ncbi:MAG: anti-sigma factor family protein, partial [Anaerolineae bacterium]